MFRTLDPVMRNLTNVSMHWVYIKQRLLTEVETEGYPIFYKERQSLTVRSMLVEPDIRTEHQITDV